jgi:hypothetical protein
MSIVSQNTSFGQVTIGSSGFRSVPYDYTSGGLASAERIASRVLVLFELPD